MTRPNSCSRNAYRLRTGVACAAVLLVGLISPGGSRAGTEPPPTLPGTTAYVDQADLADRALSGIKSFLVAQTAQAPEARSRHWRRDLSSPEAYERSVAPNRERLRNMIGATDPRLPVTELHLVATIRSPAKVLECDRYTVHRVRWPVFDGVFGEGLLVEPKTTPTARVVVVPDAGQTPEMLLGLAPGVSAESQFAARLAAAGCQLLIPTLVSRDDTWSGNAALNRFTNQPHREWIYRQAFEMGRHIIGYEVQKIQSALDWFDHQRAGAPRPEAGEGRLGVVGYGEGGLLALYTAALDRRIEAVLVSGYFGSREELWQEPIYRNVFGLLDEFGDAELAGLVAPRRLIVEASHQPVVEGPPAARDERNGAAPGRIAPASVAAIRAEFIRAQQLLGDSLSGNIRLVTGSRNEPVQFGSRAAIDEFLTALHVTPAGAQPVQASRPSTVAADEAAERQRRQVKELEEFTQKLVVPSETDRAAFFWHKAEAETKNARVGSPAKAWAEATREYRNYFWDEIIGRFPAPGTPLNARTRLFRDEPGWRGYIVVLDMWPGAMTWGYLLVPKDIKPGERRPAVVCQHGGSSIPDTTLDVASRAYKAYAGRLADLGYVVFAPYNPNYARGRERMYELQRLANPLKKSIFSVIVAQHDRVLDFLGGLPFVDAGRIGFYGLSYGGKTAMRVPALLERYAVTICSGDFNEWVRKTVSVDAVPGGTAAAYQFVSYMFTGDYEITEFNLARTFNYAEMAALIAPRPFMVERGHYDRVGSDEWVAYEYAKVRRLYNSTLKLPDHTAIEYFDGGHEIYGQGSLAFLHRHLQWPR